VTASAASVQQTDEHELTVLMFTEAAGVADIYRQHLPPRWRLEHLASRRDEGEQRERLARADVLIHSDVPLSGELLDAARRLRLIHRVGVGLDSLDLDAVAGRGVPVCICPVGTPEAVAEHAILLMLAAGRHLPRMHDEVTKGRWPKWEYRSRSLGLFSSTVGIVGFGRTGQAVAERLDGFGCRLLVHRRPGRVLDDRWRDRVEVTEDLDEVFSRSHVVTLHCPLTPETRGLVDARRLGLMRPDAVFVNAARGGLVVEDDLVAALSRGRPAAAGLDVLAQEPPPADHPLFGLPNAVITPHCAAGVAQVQHVKAQAIAANVRRLLAGEELLYRVR
jgi:phosphoglycerate dehydrogenase-like enzyme